MARLRIDEPDRLDVRFESVQYRNQLSLCDCGVDEIVLQLREPVTGASGVADCRTIAETYISFGWESFFNAFLKKTPVPGKSRLAECKRQTIVVNSSPLFRIKINQNGNTQ